MPHVFTGLRLGPGISWAYLVLGELSGVPDGLGAIIVDARMAGPIDMIVAGIIVIAVIGRLSDRMLKTFMGLCFFLDGTSRHPGCFDQFFEDVGYARTVEARRAIRMSSIPSRTMQEGGTP